MKIDLIKEFISHRSSLDSYPQIVWDPENKRWINTDGEVAEEEAFKPPPKMSDFNHAVQQPNMSAPPPMPSPAPALTPVAPQIPQSNQMPGDYGLPANHMNPYGGNTAPISDIPTNNNNDQPAKVPNLQSNMFKMQRNKSELNCGKKRMIDIEACLN